MYRLICSIRMLEFFIGVNPSENKSKSKFTDFVSGTIQNSFKMSHNTL